MPRQTVTDSQPSFAGGLNTVSDDSALLPSQVRRCENGRLTDIGAVMKRRGTQRTSAAVLAAASVLDGFGWRKASGAVETMAVCNGALYTTTYGSFPLTWTAQVGALSTTGVPVFAHFHDGSVECVYLADGGALNKWDGTTLSVNLASTPNVSTVAVHNARLWGAGNASAPQALYYSALNDGDGLGVAASGGGAITVRTFGNQAITQLASVGSSLLVFHRTGISRLTGYGQDEIAASPAGISADVGTIAPQSVQVWQNACFFVSDRGLYVATENAVQPVATPEKPDPLTSILRALTGTEIAQIHAQIARQTNELWIWVPGQGIYVYHLLLQSWAGPWTGGLLDPNATTCLFETVNAAGLPIVLRGDDAGWVSEVDRPSVFKDDVAADDTGGTTIVLTVQCHRMYFGDPAQATAPRWAYVLAARAGSANTALSWNTATTNGTFQFRPSTDSTWGGSTTTWGGGTWGGIGSRSERVPLSGTGYFVDLTITDSGEAVPVFSRVGAEAFALGRR